MIRIVSIDNDRVTTLHATCGNIDKALFGRISGIAIDEKNNCLYVSDCQNQVIRKVDMSDCIHSLWI